MQERLRAVREDNDDSTYSLSEKIHFHRVQITRYETGVSTPPISYIIAFCQLYGVSADYILGLPKNGKWPR